MFNFFGPDMLFRIPALLIAITFHEYAHARAADFMGDPTPRYSGRLTLNPIDHLDPVGLLMLLFFRFGWAKPVPINPRHFRDVKKGMILVSLAGPLANVVLAFITLLLLKMPFFPNNYFAFQLGQTILIYNLVLAVFNIIPIPPLDGSKLLMAVLPGRQAYAFAQLEQYGNLLLVALLVTGIISNIMDPLATGLWHLLDWLTGILTFWAPF